MKERSLKAEIKTALGEGEADLLIKGCRALNVFTGEFEESDILVSGGYIVSTHAMPEAKAKVTVDAGGLCAVPGFIDGHIHLESAFISPLEFAKAVSAHGTTAAVVDPHEIANVAGEDGIDYILGATENLPIDIYLMVPSCVPATYIDETGAELRSETVKKYLGNPRVLGLAEMMNYPGLLMCDPEVTAKIKVTLEIGKSVDGHAPGLSGAQLDAYCASGVDSDHECTDADEALEKLRRGQWIMIREGTACKNLEALAPVLKKYPGRCIFCCDDRNPADLSGEGHIDNIIRKAIGCGVSPENAYTVASYGAAQRFGMKSRGALAPGYRADIVLIDGLSAVSVRSVYKDGELMDKERLGGWSTKENSVLRGRITNTVNAAPVTDASFALHRTPEKVIKLVPWQIITEDGGTADGVDTSRDIVKICVVERFKATGHIGTALLSGYGLKRGAVATTVAHDSHNIITAGVSDSDIALAVTRLGELHGGMVVVCDGRIKAELALPIGGLMTDISAREAGEALRGLKEAARSLGVADNIDPFMTLSFASLPVIPSLRLTTHGIFDVNKFAII